MEQHAIQMTNETEADDNPSKITDDNSSDDTDESDIEQVDDDSSSPIVSHVHTFYVGHKYKMPHDDKHTLHNKVYGPTYVPYVILLIF